MKHIKNKQLFEKHTDKQINPNEKISCPVGEFYDFYAGSDLDEILDRDNLINYWVLSDVNKDFKLIVIENENDELELIVFNEENVCVEFENHFQEKMKEYSYFKMKEYSYFKSDADFDKVIEEYKTLINGLRTFDGKTIEECKQTKIYKDNPPKNPDITDVADINKMKQNTDKYKI